MALNSQNTDQISFKKLSGKAHTQQNFAVTEESIASNVTSSFATVFSSRINPTPLASGLTALYASDNVVERVRFDIDIIPDTFIGTNQSQGYRLKLPASYTGSGKLGTKFSGGTYLHNALGKLQIVPPLYGKVKPDGSTEFDPILYQTDGTTVIPKFDTINWYLDFYNGVLFVQNPPAGFDLSSARPRFVDAFLFVGKYLDNFLLTGITASSVSWNNISSKPTNFTPTPHTHDISGVTGLQSALNSKIDLTQKGATNGVAPLDSNQLVPVINIPPIFKEIYVVNNIGERNIKFIASGGTPVGTQVESYPGLRVLVLSGTTGTTTGTTEYVDKTGFLSWKQLTSPNQAVIDWDSILGKPLLVNQIVEGAGISVLNGGTGFTTIIADLDNNYVGNLVPSGKITVNPFSLDPTRLKFQNNNTGTTGQYIIRGTGSTFQAVNLPILGVSTLTALSGVTNIGTAQDPIIIAQIDNADGVIGLSGAGLRILGNSIGINKLKLGSTPNSINADQIPIFTGSTYTNATDVGTAIEKLYTGITANNSKISINIIAISGNTAAITVLQNTALTGGTNLGTGQGIVLKGISGRTSYFRTIKQGPNVAITNNANDITIGVTGITTSTTIGPAEDGSYTDGVFTDFTTTTPIGTAVDRFNELFLLVLPQQPDNLLNINGTSSFVNGNLSWGVSRNDIGYTNVGTNAGNAAVNINGLYTASATRLGIISSSVTGFLNSNVVGSGTGIPFFDRAFKKGDEGKLQMYRNNVLIAELSLSGTTLATSNAYFNVSAVQFVKATNGSPVTVFKYRTGTYTIPVSAMTTGYNYFRVTHVTPSTTATTNFLEFVYDSDATNIIASATGLTNLTLSGSKNMSGVKYHTSGTIRYDANVANAYRNVYSASATAIDFPNKENLGAITNMNVTGAGIISRTGSTLQTLPILNSGATNPQTTSISVAATLPISSTVVLGNVGTTGRLRSGFSVAHPFTSQQISGGLSTVTGFLVYNITQANSLNSENFTGEVNRLEARNYAALTYANVNSGTYAWNSAESLIGVNTLHNTGLLVFNDELIYPNAAYLTTQYGITTGNFASVTNSPAANVNYTSATGIRDHYRVFKSANGTTQATLTFTIEHTGNAANFLTNGGTGGTASGNNIKFEFLIMRSGGAIHGWANPFANTGNPEGITNTSTSHVGAVTTVTCTLSTVPRVAQNDIVIVRVFAASGWTNRIQTISITNI